MSFGLLSGAKRELFAAARWYEDKRLGLGDDLLGEVVASLRRLETFPQAGSPTAGGYRRCIVRRFPYSLIYRHFGNRIIVVAVAHHKRRPRYWLPRAVREDTDP